ncbi:MAG: PEP-CTERM sorting domain-containing protein [Desulfobacteraceae bacterium]|nr:PEP-CTERM sorting domain-containing protein [Desulfobacteraceae bacterium]
MILLVNSNLLIFLVPMLRVGMQGVAFRADIRRAKLTWQIFVPILVDTPQDDMPETPEPGMLALLMTGIFGFVFFNRFLS